MFLRHSQHTSYISPHQINLLSYYDFVAAVGAENAEGPLHAAAVPLRRLQRYDDPFRGGMSIASVVRRLPIATSSPHPTAHRPSSGSRTE